MKVFAFALALAGVTTTASLDAQVIPRPGTVITGTSQRRTDCTYNRTTNSIGDIVFGRTNLNTNCRDVRSREDGAWYQVGHGRSPIFQRRIRDNNGNLIIQRARRNSDGTFTILNSRVASNSDKEWRKEQKEQEKEFRKEQKERDKELRKGDRDDDHRGIRGDDDRDEERGVRRDDDRDEHRGIRRDDDDDDDRGDDRRVNNGVLRNDHVLGRGNSERGEHGRGKGKKGRD